MTNQVAELKHVFDMVGDKIDGSNWKLKDYINFTVEVFKIRPTRGSSYIPTPTRFSNPKCGLINIRNEDNQCFKWCMM